MEVLQAWWNLNGESFWIVVVAATVGWLIGLQKVFLSEGSIRIHMLVALGSALFVYLPLRFGVDANISQLVQGVATGIGFLGAGAILKRPEEGKISGVTVAGTIWLTAALGMAVGLGLIVLPLIVAVILSLLMRVPVRS